MNFHDEIDLNQLALSNMMPKRPVEITDEELQKLNKKAYLEATHQFLKTAYLREHVRRLTETGELPFEIKDKKCAEMMDTQAKVLCQKPPYLWLTINPMPGVGLKELQKVVAKLLSKVSIKSYAYSYEVRNSENKGLHVHLALFYSAKPYDFKRSIRSTCKGIVGNVKDPNIINFKFVDDVAILEKIEYLMGNKKPEKMAGYLASVAFRKANGLPELIESSPHLPCRATQKMPLICEEVDDSDNHTNDEPLSDELVHR